MPSPHKTAMIYEMSVLTGQCMDALMQRIEEIREERSLEKGGCR